MYKLAAMSRVATILRLMRRHPKYIHAGISILKRAGILKEAQLLSDDFGRSYDLMARTLFLEGLAGLPELHSSSLPFEVRIRKVIPQLREVYAKTAYGDRFRALGVKTLSEASHKYEEVQRDLNKLRNTIVAVARSGILPERKNELLQKLRMKFSELNLLESEFKDLFSSVNSKFSLDPSWTAKSLSNNEWLIRGAVNLIASVAMKAPINSWEGRKEFFKDFLSSIVIPGTKAKISGRPGNTIPYGIGIRLQPPDRIRILTGGASTKDFQRYLTQWAKEEVRQNIQRFQKKHPGRELPFSSLSRPGESGEEIPYEPPVATPSVGSIQEVLKKADPIKYQAYIYLKMADHERDEYLHWILNLKTGIPNRTYLEVYLAFVGLNYISWKTPIEAYVERILLYAKEKHEKALRSGSVNTGYAWAPTLLYQGTEGRKKYIETLRSVSRDVNSELSRLEGASYRPSFVKAIFRSEASFERMSPPPGALQGQGSPSMPPMAYRRKFPLYQVTLSDAMKRKYIEQYQRDLERKQRSQERVAFLKKSLLKIARENPRHRSRLLPILVTAYRRS